jgi:hypothetical protein
MALPHPADGLPAIEAERPFKGGASSGADFELDSRAATLATAGDLDAVARQRFEERLVASVWSSMTTHEGTADARRTLAATRHARHSRIDDATPPAGPGSPASKSACIEEWDVVGDC